MLVTDELHSARMLKIADLRRAMVILLDAATERFGDAVNLDEQPEPISMYWSLGAGTAYRLAEDPEQGLTVGDVDDDLSETADLLKRHDREVVLWHDLAHLVGLLGVLAYLDLPERGVD